MPFVLVNEVNGGKLFNELTAIKSKDFHHGGTETRRKPNQQKNPVKDFLRASVSPW
jgi:hypothetical protein